MATNGIARTPEEIRADIERSRAEIATSIVELRREVEATTDWREWVRKRPLPFIAGAVAIGFLLGSRR